MQFVLWLAAVYLIICVLGFFLQRHFMYYPSTERVSPVEAGLTGVEELRIESPNGAKLITWRAPAYKTKPTILYFHGNAGNAASRAGKIEVMQSSGYGIFYLNNRGYGGSDGSPSEAANVSDALTAYDYLIKEGFKPNEIVAYGESLGTGQAVQLAGQRELKAVIIEAPLTNTVDIARSFYWYLPLQLMLTDQYSNIDHISRVNAPLLILHGQRDEVIPYSHSERLYAAARTPKQLELFPEAAHSDLFDHGAWDKASAFLDALPKT